MGEAMMKSLSILYIYCLTIKLFGTLLSQKSFLNFSIIFLSLSLSLSGTSRLKVKVWNLIKCFYVISFFASTAAEAAEQLPPAREKMLKQMKQIKFYTFNLAIILRQRI